MPAWLHKLIDFLFIGPYWLKAVEGGGCDPSVKRDISRELEEDAVYYRELEQVAREWDRRADIVQFRGMADAAERELEEL